MALKDKLETGGGSVHTQWDGTTPSQMPGASKQSRLHNTYSINGNPNMQGGPGDIIGSPSLLDINGVEPSTALKDPSVGSINNTFSKGKYENYVLQTQLFQDRVDDITG